MAQRLGRTVHSINGAAAKLGLKKLPEVVQRCGRLQKGHTLGRAYQFRAGNVPANKGLRRPPGWSAGLGRMQETQFKKGQLNGFAAAKYRPVGTILADNSGYLHIKVRERQPGDGPGWDPEVWPLLHHQVWREEHHGGPIPKKHMVAFKDRNRSNCAIENLELISMGENARRNRMWNRFPRELAEAIQLNGVLKRKLRRAANGKEQN